MFVQSISSLRLQEAHDLWCRAAHDDRRGVVAKACRRGVVPDLFRSRLVRKCSL